MHFPEPAQAAVNPQTGELAGASRRYQKRIRGLDGLYLDGGAFESIAAVRGDEIAYYYSRIRSERVVDWGL